MEGSEISLTPAQPSGRGRVRGATRGEEEGAPPPQLVPPPLREQGVGGGGGGGAGGWISTPPCLPLPPPALPPLPGPGGVDPLPAGEQGPDRERQRVTPNPSMRGESVIATPTPGEHAPGEGRVAPQVESSSRSAEQPTLPQPRAEQQAVPQPNPWPALTFSDFIHFKTNFNFMNNYRGKTALAVQETGAKFALSCRGETALAVRGCGTERVPVNGLGPTQAYIGGKT